MRARVAGDLARDARRDARRVERQRVAPQHLQALADAGLGEVGEFDAMRARVGERGVGGAGACEVGVQLDDVADIDDDQERRPALVGGQRASVAFGLAARPLQGVVETLAGSDEADLLGFENEMAALVAVDAPARRAAVAVAKADAALEDVGIVAAIVVCRVGGGDVEQPTEVGDEELIVGQLGTVGRAPAGPGIAGRSVHVETTAGAADAADAEPAAADVVDRAAADRPVEQGAEVQRARIVVGVEVVLEEDAGVSRGAGERGGERGGEGGGPE
jgi:hypothetical protein